MKIFLKVLKVLMYTGIILFVLVTSLIGMFIHGIMVGDDEIIESFRAYSPPFCPNTKWVCQEEDIFFISDSQGYSTGQVISEDGARLFTIAFYYRRESFGVSEFFADYDNQFAGNVSYNEKGCVLTYQGEEDTENFFGDKTGLVTLTFIKEPFPAGKGACAR